MRRTIVGLLSAAALLAGAATARADAGSFSDVNVTTDALTLNVHVDWSACKTYGYGLPPLCAWYGMVRVQQPDTECGDPSAGGRLWISARQSQAGKVDEPLTMAMAPERRVVLCLYAWSITNGESGGWVSLARQDVTAPPLPPQPWTPEDAKVTSVLLIGQLSRDPRAMTLTCKGDAASGSCAASWADAIWKWQGNFALTDTEAHFAGLRASSRCLKRHRRSCWAPYEYRWAAADPTGQAVPPAPSR